MAQIRSAGSTESFKTLISHAGTSRSNRQINFIFRPISISMSSRGFDHCQQHDNKFGEAEAEVEWSVVSEAD
jgi:hypothetical protein